MKLTRLCTAVLTVFALSACSPSTDDVETTAPPAETPQYGVQEIDGVEKKTIEGFGGVIARSYEDSEEWWPEYVEL